MGWPKKDQGFKLYFERKAKTYLIHDPEYTPGTGNYEGIGEVMMDNNPETPMLASTGVSPTHIYSHCRRASWAEMPTVWQDAMAQWINGKPEEFRGLWRIEELDEYKLLIGKSPEDLPLLINKQWKFKHINVLYEKLLKEAEYKKETN